MPERWVPRVRTRGPDQRRHRTKLLCSTIASTARRRKRAAAAKGGIYGNDAIEAMYPMCKSTASGDTLDGSKHNYTLTFAKNSLPPVDAFWSVTMYDGKTQLLIDNPINRYLINSPMLPGMKKNAAGSLTLYTFVEAWKSGCNLAERRCNKRDGESLKVTRGFVRSLASPQATMHLIS